MVYPIPSHQTELEGNDLRYCDMKYIHLKHVLRFPSYFVMTMQRLSHFASGRDVSNQPASAYPPGIAMRSAMDGVTLKQNVRACPWMSYFERILSRGCFPLGIVAYFRGLASRAFSYARLIHLKPGWLLPEQSKKLR